MGKETIYVEQSARRRYLRTVLVGVLLLLTYLYTVYDGLPAILPSSQPARPSFTHLASHCADISPISASEFASRRAALASALTAINATAYIAEPGPNALYYANVSDTQWHLSERPLLFIITNKGDVTVITPSFEATRAKLLAVPADNITYIEWAEAASPYAAALRAIPFPSDPTEPMSMVVDENARFFVADGLRLASPDYEVSIAPPEIRALREQKTPAELKILRCVNEVTLLAVREVRKHLYIGMHESEAQELMQDALSGAGLGNHDVIVLFGENAALPHGTGTDRTLTAADFVLIDTGGALHGYHSDLTRTFALPDSKIPEEHLKIWYAVQTAQKKALASIRPGIAAAEVDSAARSYLDTLGLAPYFTHRLGHGIGLEVHESPYLLPDNPIRLAIGNSFSDEPGVYIEGKVGMRLEDCFVVTDGEGGEPFTAGVGGLADGPWDP